ncbi:MAG: hypothetical protein HY013_13350 [Candidatus Solibacter usitatus]|nr:hypothetical protein [Candidatus Solibacter usitatus]
MTYRRTILLAAVFCALLIVIASATATLICFPWSHDPQSDVSVKTRDFYERAYAKEKPVNRGNASSDVVPLSTKE